MKKNIVEISFTGNNFSAHVPDLPGCVSTGHTPAEVKTNILEAIQVHLAGMKEDRDEIPTSFKGKYELAYKFDAQTLLNYYKDVFKAPALARLTGINEKQIHHYATGHRKPRPEMAKKFETALHELGRELIALEV